MVVVDLDDGVQIEKPVDYLLQRLFQIREQVDQAIALLDAKELDDAKNLLENVASILAIICE